MLYGGYWASIGCLYLVRFRLSALRLVLDEYWMCLFDEVLLSVFWVVFGEYFTCVFVKVSLNVLLRVLSEYWMCIW